MDNVPLSLRLQQARMRILKAVNEAAADNSLTAHLMEGVISSIHADIRAQATAELIIEMSTPQKEEPKQEGNN